MKPASCLLGSKSSRCLTLELKVFPSGSAAYDATLTEAVSLEWMPRVQPGSWLIVAVDKSDPQKVTLDEVAFQRPPPTPVE